MSPRLSISPDDALMHGQSDEGVWDGAKFVKVRRARPRRVEDGAQIAIKNRLALYGIVFKHTPNEGRRSLPEAKRMKALGLIPGWPDGTCMQEPGRIAFLEVKRPGYSPSDVSDEQRDCHAMLRRLGFHVAIVTDQDEAVEALRGWGFSV